MRYESERDEPGFGYIHCVNIACGSNGGCNFDGIRAQQNVLADDKRVRALCVLENRNGENTPLMDYNGTPRIWAYQIAVPVDVLETLISCLQSIPAVKEGWKEIESAPDGKRIMVYNGSVHEWYRNGEYWFDNAGNRILKSLYPTRWQSLPAAPEVE